VAVLGVVSKPDGAGGEWRIYAHHDGTADLMHQSAPGQPSKTYCGRAPLYRVRAYMRENGIGEDGWTAE